MDDPLAARPRRSARPPDGPPGAGRAPRGPLEAKNVVLDITTVYQGNVSTALVRVAELFRDAVRAHAAGLIVVHNHPSGDPEPSPDDLHLTAECIAAGRLLDIPLLDHLLVGHDAWISLRDRGMPFDRPGGGALG